ncbi:MAG: DUF5677 domain-containing protein [Candidatus Hatepunaea meridiana]|nr:DUF5677 domain-containing protein [Candidatus Hatepunaea meridiana]
MKSSYLMKLRNNTQNLTLRLYKMDKKYKLTSSIIENGRDFGLLVDSIFLVSEFTKQTDIISIGNDWLLDADMMLYKAFSHGCTIKHLTYGTPIPILTQGLVDVSSINVLTRALLETTLVFYYLFITSNNSDERQLRYLKWQLSDLLKRQSMMKDLRYSGDDKEAVRKSDEVNVKIIRDKIKQNKEFKYLTAKQQKYVIENFQDWRLPLQDHGYYPSWIKLGRDAGLNNHYSELFYNHISSYAHSGSMSILQLRQGNKESIDTSIRTSITATMVAFAMIIKGFWEIVPMSEQALNDLEMHKSSVDIWYSIGTKEDQDVTKESSKTHNLDSRLHGNDSTIKN